MKSSNIGGQAVLEGIMMKNGKDYAVAVRKPDKEIEVKKDEYRSFIKWEKLTKIPFIRGIFNFIDSMVLGMKTLTYSASFYEEEETSRVLTEEEAKKHNATQWSYALMAMLNLEPRKYPSNGMAAWKPPKYRPTINAPFQFILGMASPLQTETANASMDSPTAMINSSANDIVNPPVLV